jgi:hypothetical protein
LAIRWLVLTRQQTNERRDDRVEVRGTRLEARSRSLCAGDTLRSTRRKDVRRIALMFLAASLATQAVAAAAEQQNGANVVLRVGVGTGARVSNYPDLLAAITAARVSRRRDPKAPLRFELAAGEIYHLRAPLDLPPEISGSPSGRGGCTST